MKKRAVRDRRIITKQNPIKGILHDLNTQLQDYLEALKSVTSKENS